MPKHLQFVRQVNHAETLEEAEGGHRGIKIQAGRKSGSQNQAEGFDWIHGLAASHMGIRRFCSRYHEVGKAGQGMERRAEGGDRGLTKQNVPGGTGTFAGTDVDGEATGWPKAGGSSR